MVFSATGPPGKLKSRPLGSKRKAGPAFWFIIASPRGPCARGLSMTVNLDSLTSYILVVTAFFGAFLSALWLSLVIWTFRDMRSRSRDIFAQILAALVVGVLTLPGLVIYLILRPANTLSETYEQSLEEEALLQEIEDKRVCP